MEIENEDKNEKENIGICNLLQKTNRILTENEKINLMESNEDLAFTDRLTIFLNFKQITTLTNNDEEFLILSKGLNYHELSHILFTDYTPNKIEKFLREIKTTNICDNDFYILFVEFKKILNLLEDCRIENLFFVEYPRSKFYFSFTALKVIINNFWRFKEDIRSLLCCYLVLYGRKFFNNNFKKRILNIRSNLIKKGLTEDLIKKCEKLTDKYIIELDLNKKLELTFKLFELIHNIDKNKKFFMDKNLLISPNNHFSKAKGNKRAIEKAIKKLLEFLKNKKISEKGFSNLNINSNDKNKKTSTTLNDFLKDILNEINKNNSIKTEIENDLNKLNGIDSGFNDFDGFIFKATNEIKTEVKKVEKTLRVLRTDLNTQIFKFQRKGKIDITSVIKSQKNQSLNIFKKEKLNRIDKSKMGFYFLLDSSGSISNLDFKNEIQATYILCKSLENLNNKTAIIEFSDNFRILKNFKNKGDWKRSFNSGTSIYNPLLKSIQELKKLRNTERINNLFMVIVSDGLFNERNMELKPVFDDAKKSGIKLIWILASEIYNKSEIANKHIEEIKNEMDYFMQIKNLEDLNLSLKEIIKKLQKEINQKVNNQAGFYN